MSHPHPPLTNALLDYTQHDNLRSFRDFGRRHRLVVLVGGATASGKSSLALSCAESCSGTLINADSLQLYRDLERFTAAPSPSDKARAPHRLYGRLDAHEQPSAAQWLTWAIDEIHHTLNQDRLPLVVGGTGFYLKALTEGFSPIPELDPEAQHQLRAELSAQSTSALTHALQAKDPHTLSKLLPNDRHRILRALEVWHLTGKPLSHWHSLPAHPPCANLRFLRVLCAPERQRLYQTIDARFATMAQDLSTLEDCLSRHPDPTLPVYRALGVRPLIDSLRGILSFDAAVAQGQQQSRHYAKRQLTWFRHQWTPEIVLSPDTMLLSS